MKEAFGGDYKSKKSAYMLFYKESIKDKGTE